MTLYHEVAGTGPPVLLLHCALCDGRQWDRQMETFAPHFRVVRVDLSGFGRSPVPNGPFSHAEDVLGVLGEVGVERTAIVGNSFGGRIAVDVALAAPEQVSGLVLADAGYPGAEPFPEVAAYAAQADALFQAGDIEGSVELNLRFWLDGPRRSPDAVDPTVRARVAGMQRLTLEKELELDGEPGAERRPDGSPREIRAPTLVVVGDQDQPQILAAAERYVTEIPGAERVVIAGAAHVPNLERPDEFDDVVLRFLLGLPPVRP